MKSLTVILLLTLILTGCGRDGSHTGFEPQVAVWESLTGHPLTGVTIEFGEPTFTTQRARCDHGPFTTPTIVINKHLWFRQSATTQELIILHELGHCVLGRAHSTGIMHPDLITDMEYLTHREALQHALLTD